MCDRPIFVGPVTRIFVFIGCQPGSGHLGRPIVMPSDTKFIVLDFVYSVLIVLEFVVVVIVVVKNRPLKKDVGRLQSF